MNGPGLQEQITSLLETTCTAGGYHELLVCTDDGLLIAATSDAPSADELAGITSLFDTIVQRATRDLSMETIDEVTMLAPSRGRVVVRPLSIEGEQRFFLVAWVPRQATWRRYTNQLARQLSTMLKPLAAGEWG